MRLDALKEAPYAFGSTYEGELDYDEANWRARLVRRPTFVAEVDGVVAGTVATGDGEVSGAAAMIAMWVDPKFRRRGIGDDLVRHVIGWAAEQAYDRIFLWVTDVNVAAQRLYARNGFVPTGARQEVREGEPAMEFEMARALRSQKRR